MRLLAHAKRQQETPVTAMQIHAEMLREIAHALRLGEPERLDRLANLYEAELRAEGDWRE